MRLCAVLIITVCCSVALLSQEVDPLFNPPIFSKAIITQAAIDSKGNIYFTGNYDLVDGEPRSGISKLNPDGSLSKDFNIGSGFDGDIFRLVALSTDQLLVIGGFTTYNGVATGPMVKISEDGSIDESFAKSTETEPSIQNSITNVIELANGKLLVYGRFTRYNGFATNSIVILNQDGTVDSHFSYQKEDVLSISQAAPQSLGKIIVAVNRDNSQTEQIVRLNADGTIDETFNYFDTDLNKVYKIMAQSTDKLLVLTDSPEGDQLNVDLIRLNADGTKDDSFDLGTGIHGFFDDFQLNGDDEILIGSSYTQTEEGGSVNGNPIGLISKLEPDGAFVKSFASRHSGDSSKVVLSNNDELAIYGRFLSVEDHATRGIALFDNDEVTDEEFSADIRSVGETSIVTRHSGDYTYLGTRYSEDFDNLGRIGLFLNNGLVEPTSIDIEIDIPEIRVFKPVGVGIAVAGGPAGSTPIFRMIATDDRGFVFNSDDYRFNDNWVNNVEKSFLYGTPVYAVGSFSGYNGQTEGVAGIVRFGIGGDAGAGMGDIDNTFVSPFSADSVNITDVKYHTDNGKVIVVGVFSPAGSDETNLINGIARLNEDGSFDETFDWSNHFTGGIIQNVEIIEDGYIIVGGFTRPRRGIAKVNLDGSLDTEFNADNTFLFNKIVGAQVFGDAIYVGGDLTEYQSQKVCGLMKLNLDGNLDNSFKLPNTLYAKVNDINVDHTITLAGMFYDSTQSRKLSAVRLGIRPDNAPTDLTFSDVSYDNVNLNWTDMSTNEEGFIVEVSQNDQNHFSEIRITEANKTTENHTPPESGSTYYYRVASFKGDLKSEYSNTVEVAVPLKPLAAPSNLVGTVVTDNQIDLSWTDNSENEESFVIAKTVNHGELKTIGSVLANQTSYSDTDIEASQALEYMVWARNSNQDSPASNVFRIVITSIEEGIQNQGNRFDFTYDQITNDLSFILKSPADKIRSYQVVSSSGMIKMREEGLRKQEVNQSLSGSAPGIYILHVTSDHNKYIVKFIKK